MTPTDRFAALVRGPEAQLPLDEAALLVAAHAEPGLDVGEQMARLDEVAARCDEPTMDAVRALLFGELALQGNTSDYSDPRNSFLDQVLDRRVGIPISLSVVTIEIGRRVGVPFEGVGLPGHFLVRHVDDPPVLMDPFHHGRLLDLAACASLFQSLYGPAAPFSPSLLAAVGSRQILARMLANLKNSYADRGDSVSLAWVVRLRANIPGVPATELAELARVLVNLGRFAEAADALDHLVAAGDFDDADVEKLTSRASMLRARLN
ncbi:MAG TPA: transglutaminase-like domain-containing protein [Acidimicrobiales bacterium]|nr:transglutaminase-like domain-containing protein [Acidimicrobiales bacterium]